ncbi:MAG: MBL fold metallo-hydrolase [Alphaproteobacteria bacterium]|nr:MBL fold metallo-hydrolase [Alphaproteobacteria bacterium]
MHPIHRLMAAAGATAVALASIVHASAPPTQEMVDRFYRGRAVINAAADAAGGAQVLRSMTALSFEVSGDVSNDIQGYSPARIGNPARDGRQRVVNRFDFAGQRFYQRVEQSFASGYDSAFTTIWRGGTQYAVRYVPRDYTQTANAPSPFAAGGPVMVASRWLPPVILQRALQNFRTAAWVGESVISGAAADVVEVSFDEATRFRIHVTRTDRKVRRVEALAPDPISADDVSVAELSGDQTAGGIVFPTRIVASRRGAVVLNLELGGLAVNPTYADAAFAPPPAFTQRTEDVQVHTTQIGGSRVYEVSGLAGGTYQVPFVVMSDFVVAYEAPLGMPATRQVIAEIKRVAGPKPIRYVVISHFHNDHSSGVGAYADIGATILSSEDSRGVLQSYAANRPQFQGLEGRRDDVQLKFQAVPEDGYDIVDGAGSHLQVVNFGDISHTTHMLGLFDAESGVVMGADHYIPAVTWNPTFERFAKWLNGESRAATVLGVHHHPTSRTDVLADAKRRKPEMQRKRAKWEE